MKSKRLTILVVAILVLQVLVPALALVAPGKPNRLGWQMYSGLGQEQLQIVDEDGNDVEVPWNEILANTRRVELDWTRHLPERICTHVHAEELTVIDGRRARTVTC